MHTLSALLAALAAYVLGSIAFAIVVSRLLGLPDPRGFGSGNPGATNVLRSGSKLAAVLTLLLDAFKGWLPVVLAQWAIGAGRLDALALPLVALAVFLGHLYPVFFGFKGGKGVATAAGILLAVNPWLGLATLVTWLIVAGFTRYSSLAALAAALFAPVYAWFGNGMVWQVSPPLLLALTAISLLVLWRHRANLRKLRDGTEGRIGGGKH
jgi:glycerol-3-phosphate acyltransferase PlsY